MSNLNFCGKKEVMYALKRSAQEVYNAEVCNAATKGPRPATYKIYETKSSEGLANAYMDMAIYDDEFVNTIKDFSADKTKELKQILKPIKLQFTEINPLSKFIGLMSDIIQTHDKDIPEDTVNCFIKNIS